MYNYTYIYVRSYSVKLFCYTFSISIIIFSDVVKLLYIYTYMQWMTMQHNYAWDKALIEISPL